MNGADAAIAAAGGAVGGRAGGLRDGPAPAVRPLPAAMSPEPPPAAAGPVPDPVPAAGPGPARGVPRPLAVVYTAFLAVLVPVYWANYGPTNFLYFCDVALFLTLISVWTNRALPASAAAVGILVPQAVWVVDFLAAAAGRPLLGMTAYMFDPTLSLFARGLSFFHFWLPFLLGYVVWRLGYDRRGLALWTGLAVALLLAGYFLLPAPPAPAGFEQVPVNVNYVYGPSDDAPQRWVPPLVWLGGLLGGLPVLVFLPTHLLLRRVCRDATPRAEPLR